MIGETQAPSRENESFDQLSGADGLAPIFRLSAFSGDEADPGGS